MKVVYRFWEPSQGLEELQARIYNENNPDYPQPVTAQQIIERFERDKVDPKMVRYALNEEGKPLAYIQARDYPRINETHLGYPWALPDCPKGVQDKLFDEMLEYIKQRDVTKEKAIRMNAEVQREEIVEFFKKKGLEVKSKAYRYEHDVREIAKKVYSEEEFTSRIATLEDVDLLVNLVKTDGRYVEQFSSDEDIANYFRNRVLKDGHAVLIFKDETLVMASAPLIFKLPREEERLILRFHAYLSGNEQAYKPLIINIAKECVTTGYGTDKLLSVPLGPSDSEFANILEEYNPNKVLAELSFGLKD